MIQTYRLPRGNLPIANNTSSRRRIRNDHQPLTDVKRRVSSNSSFFCCIFFHYRSPLLSSPPLKHKRKEFFGQKTVNHVPVNLITLINLIQPPPLLHHAASTDYGRIIPNTWLVSAPRESPIQGYVSTTAGASWPTMSQQKSPTRLRSYRSVWKSVSLWGASRVSLVRSIQCTCNMSF